MVEPSAVDYLDADYVIAETLMLRAAADRTILILEGESDRKLMSYFVDESLCDIIVAKGRDNVLPAMAGLSQMDIRGAVCIIDTDYDEFLGRCEKSENIIVTEEHDIEAIMIKSSALGKMLSEHGSGAKIARLRANGLSVIDVILPCAVDLGALRLYSKMKGDCLKFEGLKFRSLNKKDFSHKWEDLLTEVLQHSSKPHLPKPAISEEVLALKTSITNKFRLCCGHDLTALLGKALQSLIGSKNAGETAPEAIESHLRLGFSWDDFKSTQIYRDICKWQDNHAPYVVLDRTPAGK